MLGAFILAAALHAQESPADQKLAQRFCRALTSSEIRTFIPIAAKEDDLALDPWLSVRNFFGRNDCIAVASYRAWREEEWLIVEVDGSAAARNARHNRRAIPVRWYVRVNAGGKIAAVMSELDFATDALLRAPDDEARRAVAEQYSEILPAIARRIADLTGRADRARTRPAALFLLQWTDDPETETYAWCAVARLTRAAQQTPEAIKLVDMARTVARRTESCEVVAYADYIAAAVNDDFDHQAALTELVIPLADSLDDPEPALRALHLQAGIDHAQADHAAAFRRLESLLDLTQRYGWRDGELLALHGLAQVKESIEDRSAVIELELHTIRLASQLMNREFEARGSNVLANAIEKSDKPDLALAIRHYQHALQVAPKTLSIAAIYQINLGLALVKAGRLREAEPLLLPALAGGRAADFEANAYLFGTRLRRAQGRHEEAIDFAHKALGVGQSLYVIWEVKANLGEMLIECGRVEEGIEALRESIDLIEARRTLTTSSGIIRARYFATRQWVYASLLNVLLDQQRPDEAFAVAERMKARSLDDAWNEDAKIRLSAGEQETQRALNQRLVDLNRTVVVSTGAAEREAREQLRLARFELEQFDVNMALRHGGNLVAHAGSDPADVAARWQGPPLIEYAVLPDSLVAFVVRDGHVAARRIPNRAEIERTTERFAQRMERRDINYQPDARRLYNALIAPVADLLPAGSALHVVPDRFLWRVPFDVLIAPDRTFLSDHHAIAYAPSMIMLDSAPHRTGSNATHGLLAVGDPTIASSTKTTARYRDLSLGSLPDAVQEVRALSKLYGSAQSTVLTGSQATESAFRQLVSDYRIIHLATHGVVDDESPLYSALVLATAPNDPNDGLLEMREMSGLDLHADLFVLSGCDTARGELYPGEGVIGMSWALLMSGCPRTVVSQWKATSRSTSALMIEFHRRLLAGDTTAEALRKARLALRRRPAYRHPFYWAPFVVVGDGMTKIR